MRSALSIKILSAIMLLSGTGGFFLQDLAQTDTNPLRNAIHVFIGILGIDALSRTERYRRWFLLLTGFFLAMLAIMGFADGRLFWFYPSGTTDNITHIVLGGLFVAIGLIP